LDKELRTRTTEKTLISLAKDILEPYKQYIMQQIIDFVSNLSKT